MKDILYYLSLLLLVVIGTIFYGYVFSVLWLWFIVPLGIQPINIVHSMALLFTIRMATYQHIQQEDKKKNDKVYVLGKIFGLAVFVPFLSLLFGKLLFFFM